MLAGRAGPDCIDLPAEPDSIPRLWDWLEARLERLGPDPELAHAVRLCAEEIATNIVMHAYPGRAGGRFGVALEVADELRLQFEDGGIPFDPTAHAPPRAAESVADAALGGLGIPLVRAFVRDMAYERRDGANRLTLAFSRRN